MAELTQITYFKRFPAVRCVFSTRKAGNLQLRRQPLSVADEFLQANQIPVERLVRMEQVHGASVEYVNQKNLSSILPGVDGLVTDAKEVYLMVNTADCVPLFFYDAQRQIVGIAHAGWRGTLNKIAENMLTQFKLLKSKVEDINIVIGPHIGACCYSVPQDRASAFLMHVTPSPFIAFQQSQQWYIDIGQANRFILESAGVARDQIESPVVCTACQNDRFFSYRKDGTKTFGEMLGLIGLK